MMISVSLQSEYIATLAGVQITNTFATSVLVTLIIGFLAIIFHFSKQGHKNIVANGLRVLVFELLRLTDSVTHNRSFSKKVLPLITTFFLYIFTANLLAMLPGFLGSFFVSTPGGDIPLLRSPNSDLSTTLALAIFSVLSIQAFSVEHLGVQKYVGRFLNFKSPIQFILGFFDMISEAVRVLSFSFRLFGNVFAGEVLLLVIAFLVPYIVPLPFMILEVFVGVIQAFVFAALTLTFIGTGTLQHVHKE